MADANSPATPIASAPELPLSAPSSATPNAAPNLTATPEVVTPIPASTDAPAAVAPAPVPAADAPAPIAAEPAKVDEPAAVAEPVTAEPVAEPVVEPTKVAPAYTEFKLPETFKADPATLSAYTNVLGKYGISQEAGQELVDFHTNAMKQYADSVAQNQQAVFEKTKTDWQKASQKEFGNRFDTTLNDAKWAISQFGGTKQQQAELVALYGYSGTGNHPAQIRLLANMAKKLREPGSPANGLPSRGRQESPADRRYSGKPNGART